MIDPEVALHLARHEVSVAVDHQFGAPTLPRSQLPSPECQAARRGEITTEGAQRHLDYVRRLRIRLLGDRTLQALAWKVANELG